MTRDMRGVGPTVTVLVFAVLVVAVYMGVR